MVEGVGGTIGNYRIEALLGAGGMGRVFRAVHVLINRTVAIKVLHDQYAVDPTFQARFLREAQAAAALDHPNIVDIIDFSQAGDSSYLVMEYVPDGSLRALLKERDPAEGPLPLGMGLDLICQAADALDYAHRQGMVHRDIKPDNLLLLRNDLTETYRVKVTDFGLAKLSTGGATLTAEGQTLGTPAYMSPEQAQGIDLDGRSDIYSLGVVLFEVVTGMVPFATRSLSDAIYKHVYTPPPSPRASRPDLPEPLAAIVLRCLEKKPAHRFATAGELAGALRAFSSSTLAPPSQSTEADTRATTLQVGRVEGLEVRLDQEQLAVSPGEPALLMVTLVNFGSAPLRASVSVDGVPANWIETPPPSVQLAPGGEVSGPLRVQLPASASQQRGEFPVVVRAVAHENPNLRAEAVTQLLVRPATPPALAGGAAGGLPPAGGSDSAERPMPMPAWLAPVAAIVLLLALAGGAFAFFGGGDDNDDPLGVGATPTATATGTAASDDTPVTTATATVQPGATATSSESIATATVTEAPVELSPTATDVVVVPTDTATAEPERQLGIAFSTGRNLDDPAGVLDIYVMDPDGGNQRPLISEPDDDWLPAWSPDGTRIVWVSRQHGNHQLYIANADGSEIQQLTESTGDDLHPAWSPDGQRILFVRNADGDDELTIIDPSDGRERQLTDNNAYDGYASWSPDGRRIAWISDRQDNHELYVADITVDGAGPLRLTTDPAFDYFPVWSPDGATIAFVSNTAGDFDIFAIDATGGNRRALTDDAAPEVDPAWSPDGNWIAYVRQTDTGGEVWVMAPDGSGKRMLATGASLEDPDLTWAPDTSELLFLSQSGGDFEIWAVALDGSPARELTTDPGNDKNPSWPALPAS